MLKHFIRDIIRSLSKHYFKKPAHKCIYYIYVAENKAAYFTQICKTKDKIFRLFSHAPFWKLDGIFFKTNY